VDCISKKTIFNICILAALFYCFAAISMGMENQSQLQNVSLEQSLNEKQENQSEMILLERQARNPLRGCTGSCSKSNGTGATVNICPCNFQEHFDQENSDLWLKSDWENIDPVYLNAWLPDPDHIKVADGNLQLILDNEPCIDDVSLCHGQNFASGQYYTACNDFQYGNLSARIMAGKGNGVITSMYLFEDGGVAGVQDEIDIEIFGKYPTAPGRWEMQTNYFRQGDMGDCWEPYGIPEPCHVGVIPLSFDPTESYHDYAISWIGEGETCTDIKWYVDDKLRRHVWLDKNGYIHSNIFDEIGNIIESSNIYKGSLPNAGSRIILGLWAAQNWDLAGVFNYVSPITAKFDWMAFSQPACASDQIGVFRNGPWYLDSNGNRVWDPESGDIAFWFGTSGDIPISGDWDGDGKDEIGVFRNGPWYLDYNGNMAWDPGSADVSFWFGTTGDQPVTGDWNGDGKDEIGVFRNGPWYLDYNGNRVWDPESGDIAFWFGTSGDMPVSGDWNGDGKDEIGVFRNGPWYLDYNGNRVWDPESDDVSFWFGTSGDMPVAGNWNSDGKDEIGVFRNGPWYLDYNGNRVWEPSSGDISCWFGTSGDRPVSGRWS